MAIYIMEQAYRPVLSVQTISRALPTVSNSRRELSTFTPVYKPIGIIMRQLVIGLLFALLWASAAVATKFGIHAADPLILANVRFFLAGGGMLVFAYLIQKGQHA